jgi:hypothetical protein
MNFSPSVNVLLVFPFLIFSVLDKKLVLSKYIHCTKLYLLTSWRLELECFLFSCSFFLDDDRFFLRCSSRRWRWREWIISYKISLEIGNILLLIFSIILGIISLITRFRWLVNVWPKSILLPSGNASYFQITSFYIKSTISVNKYI